MQKYTYQHNTSTLDYLAKKNGSNNAAVMIHGYGASMMDLYGLHQFSDNFDWYFPQGTISLMGEMSRAWFPIDEQALQAAMMTGSHRDLSQVEPVGLDNVIDLLVRFLKDLPADKIILGGFSQGAMMSSHIMSRISEKLSGVTLFSGNLIHSNKLSESLGNYLGDKSLPLFQSHGRQDPILSFEGAHKLKDMIESYGFNVDFHAFDGQHEIPPQVLNAWSSFMQQCQ